jgi:hypothetical protein
MSVSSRRCHNLSVDLYGDRCIDKLWNDSFVSSQCGNTHLSVHSLALPSGALQVPAGRGAGRGMSLDVCNIHGVYAGQLLCGALRCTEDCTGKVTATAATLDMPTTRPCSVLTRSSPPPCRSPCTCIGTPGQSFPARRSEQCAVCQRKGCLTQQHLP